MTRKEFFQGCWRTRDAGYVFKGVTQGHAQQTITGNTHEGGRGCGKSNESERQEELRDRRRDEKNAGRGCQRAPLDTGELGVRL